jgi:hypothetical protein
MFAVFTTLIAGASDAGMVNEDVAVTAEPSGADAFAVPVLEMDPASTSVCVVV